MASEGRIKLEIDEVSKYVYFYTGNDRLLEWVISSLNYLYLFKYNIIYLLE